MHDWRTPISQLRDEIYLARNKGIQNINLNQLDFSLRKIEENLSINDRIELLNEKNKKSFAEEFESTYQKNLNHFSEALKIQSEQHKHYTQFIISAGYAGYFGIWSIANTSSIVTNPEAVFNVKLSAIFVLISLVSFILLEVIKVGIDGYNISVNADILFKAKLEDSMHVSESKFQKNAIHHKYASLLFYQFWYLSYPTSVIFGLGGIGILLMALIK